MKSLMILTLAIVSTNARAALREPGLYTGECHGISVMAEYQNGKELLRSPSPYHYDVEIKVEGEGSTRLETTTTTRYGEMGPQGVQHTSQSKVEQVSPNLIRRTLLALGRSCDFEVDGGGTEVLVGCTEKDGKWKPAARNSYRYLGQGNVEYTSHIGDVSGAPQEGEDFSGWTLAYSTLYCVSRPAAN